MKTSGDGVRLAAVNQIAELFDSHITGLFFNVLPSLIPDALDNTGTSQAARLLDTAKEAGDVIEAALFQRLKRLQHPTVLRRFDVVGDGDISDTVLPLAHTADTFVALLPGDLANEPEGLIENLLFRKWTSSVSGSRRLESRGDIRQHRCGVERKPGVGARTRRIPPLSASGEKGGRPRRGG
ncbi:MAG: hypothetical protein ACXWKP_32865 [Bradyrhizobium sp.]